MARSLSNVADNLVQGFDKFKCRYGHDNKKCQTCGINTKIVSVVLNAQTFEMKHAIFHSKEFNIKGAIRIKKKI